MSNQLISKCFPSFLWDFWLSPLGDDTSPQPRRIHVYDVYDNELKELHHGPKDRPCVFQDLVIFSLDVDTRRLLHELEETFSRLESVTQWALKDFLDQISEYRSSDDSYNSSLSLSRISVDELRKYFIFLRFRNSAGYQDVIHSLRVAYQDHDHQGNVSTLFRPLIARNRLRCILREFIRFLNHRPGIGISGDLPQDQVHSPSMDSFLALMESSCWSLCNSEICFGIAQDEQEFIFSERYFGTLGDGVDEESSCPDLFFPITPTLALYILGQSGESPSCRSPPSRIAWLEVGLESASDVHLRNSMVLQTYPQYLYFQSLRTVALSISSYEEFRSIPEHLDYSRLKQRCRQKFLQETVTKTLVVKGSIIVTDLTDEVVIMGDSAIAHGSFADVWKGSWMDPIERRQRNVALKFLRQVMVKGVREKLIKRLKSEVLAWHRLCHKNVSQLFGIVQNSHSVGMVSQWCDNGTVSQYLKNNPDADRLMLLTQVASGITYLHHINIIHGDLKGGNILVDENGNAVITDFGLSKIMEEITCDNTTVGTSFFGGSTRWMAPELLLALIEDDVPPISPASDVYAFGSVCLEVASGHLPYPHRSNDHAVTVDILRGIRPCRCSKCLLKLNHDGEEAFWKLVDQCWSPDPCLRPTMSHKLAFLEVLQASRLPVNPIPLSR